MDIITHKTGPYNRDWLYKAMNVGFREEFHLHPPMERVKSHKQTQDEMDEIQMRQDMPLWDWQGRCGCGRVREKKQLKANHGLCEKCKEMQ